MCRSSCSSRHSWPCFHAVNMARNCPLWGCGTADYLPMSKARARISRPAYRAYYACTRYVRAPQPLFCSFVSRGKIDLSTDFFLACNIAKKTRERPFLPQWFRVWSWEGGGDEEHTSTKFHIVEAQLAARSLTAGRYSFICESYAETG